MPSATVKGSVLVVCTLLVDSRDLYGTMKHENNEPGHTSQTRHIDAVRTLDQRHHAVGGGAGREEGDEEKVREMHYDREYDFELVESFFKSTRIVPPGLRQKQN